MRKIKSIPVLLLVVIALTLLLTACGEQPPENTRLPTATPTLPEKTPESEPVGTAEDGEGTGATGLEEIIATRAPQPTATPDRIAQEVTEFVESTRLRGTTFLGLTADNWINLAISLLIIVIGYVIGTILTRGWVGRWVPAIHPRNSPRSCTRTLPLASGG